MSPLEQQAGPFAGRAAGPLPGAGQHATKLGRSIHSGWVAAVLREAIIDGSLAARTPLVEARVADELAVSRGPVRSALHVLEGEGLVRTLPNGRTEVVGFGAGDLRDLFAVRFELEGTAIRWGAERGAAIAPLEASLAAFESEGATTPRLVELDVAFHRALVERSGSRFLVEAWKAVAPVIQTVIAIGNRRLAVADPESHFRRIVASHEPLIETIRAAKPDVATAMLKEQFELTASMFGAQGEDR